MTWPISFQPQRRYIIYHTPPSKPTTDLAMTISSHHIMATNGDGRPIGYLLNISLHRSFCLKTSAQHCAIQDWGPLTTQNTSPGEIATSLHHESERKLKILFSFEAVVQAVNQRNPTIQLLCDIYDKLSEGLFSQLKTSPTLIETLDKVTEVSGFYTPSILTIIGNVYLTHGRSYGRLSLTHSFTRQSKMLAIQRRTENTKLSILVFVSLTIYIMS